MIVEVSINDVEIVTKIDLNKFVKDDEMQFEKVEYLIEKNS